MNRLHVAVAVGAIILAGLAAAGVPFARAYPVDCYTQDTYSGGTRTTCYTGYPSYKRIITTCDGNGRCTINTY